MARPPKDVPDFIYVGDSALYANILSHGHDLKWITRVPETSSEAKKLINMLEKDITWEKIDNHYSVFEHNSNYNKVKQRWILVFSRAAYDRETKTFEKKIAKIEKTLISSWKKLCAEEFKHKEDALKAAKNLAKKAKYYQIHYNVEEVKSYSKKGRPSLVNEDATISYRLTYKIEAKAEEITAAKASKGRFILATNIIEKTEFSNAAILKEYKAQSGVESGFKFIKDDKFEVDSIFLKNPQRITALMMVMVLWADRPARKKVNIGVIESLFVRAKADRPVKDYMLCLTWLKALSVLIF